MVLAIELTAEQEERFRNGIAEQDEVQIRDALAHAVDDYLQSLMRFVPPKLTEQEWDKFADELVELVDANIDPQSPVLSDYALTRESIYGDHP